MGKSAKRKAIPDKAAPTGGAVPLTDRDARVLGADGSGSPYVALKYYSPDIECLSSWTTDEIRAFSEFCVRIRQTRWPDIYKSGGRPGRKVGFGYTPLNPLPDGLIPGWVTNEVSEDTTFFELRVGGKARVFGFRVKDAFFLVRLDRNHETLS